MNALYEHGKNQFGLKGIDWVADAISVVLVDLDTYAALISAASNATPIQMTTTAAHGFTTGETVTQVGVLGNTAANGTFTVTVLSPTTYTLGGSVGNGVYVSGGYAVNLTTNQNLSDIPAGARISTGALAGKTSNGRGFFDAADLSLVGVTGAPSEALAVYLNTGNAATSTLICHFDTAGGLPFTPNSGDATITWNVQGVFQL